MLKLKIFNFTLNLPDSFNLISNRSDLFNSVLYFTFFMMKICNQIERDWFIVIHIDY